MSLSRRKKISGFVLALLLVVSLVFSSTFTSPALAAVTPQQFAAETGASPYRLWAISFNQEIDATTLAGNVAISPSVDATIKLSATDKKIVQIWPPANGFTKGATYVITVKTGLKAIGGKALGAEVTKSFTISSAEPYTSENYTKTNLESAGLTWSGNGNNFTIRSNDYTGIYVVNQASATVDNAAVTLTGIPIQTTTGIVIPAKGLYESFDVVLVNNVIKESIRVTASGSDAYMKSGTQNIKIKNDDLVLGDNVTLYSGSSTLTLKMKDSSVLTLEPNSSIIIRSNQRNSSGMKSILIEYASGKISVAAVQPASGDDFKIKLPAGNLEIKTATSFVFPE